MTTAAMLMVEISGGELTQEVHWGKDATTETLQQREFALVNNLSSFHLKIEMSVENPQESLYLHWSDGTTNMVGAFKFKNFKTNFIVNFSSNCQKCLQVK